MFACEELNKDIRIAISELITILSKDYLKDKYYIDLVCKIIEQKSQSKNLIAVVKAIIDCDKIVTTI